MNIKQITQVGDASYYSGAVAATTAGLVMVRRMAQSDLASAWTLRPTPWFRLARQHKGLTALYALGTLAMIGGMVIRGPRLRITEFPATEDLFPVEASLDGEETKAE